MNGAILVKNEIIEAIKRGDISSNGYKIENVEEWIKNHNIGPNSIDVTLNKKIKTYVPIKIARYYDTYKVILDKDFDPHNEFYLDIKKQNKTYEYEIPDEGLILQPGILYLGATNEAIGSSSFVPMYEGRSSMARLGIQSHISAGFGDIGFDGAWTLEIITVHPVKIYPNIRIGQVYFMKVDQSEIKDNFYKGKYNNYLTPQESKSYLDFQ
jgi:dCTP deaminase